jgi:HSP20 family protein
MKNSMCTPVTRGEYPAQTMRPAINISKDEQHINLQMAIPGYRKEDLEIRIEKDTLHIKARGRSDENKQLYIRREFGFLPFEKSFKLGEHIDQEAIEAEVHDGVLTIQMATIQPVRREIAIA